MTYIFDVLLQEIDLKRVVGYNKVVASRRTTPEFYPGGGEGGRTICLKLIISELFELIIVLFPGFVDSVQDRSPW